MPMQSKAWNLSKNENIGLIAVSFETQVIGLSWGLSSILSFEKWLGLLELSELNKNNGIWKSWNFGFSVKSQDIIL